MPSSQIDYGYLMAAEAGDVRDLAVGADEDFLGLRSNLDGPDGFHGGQIDDFERAGGGQGDQQKAAVVGGGAAVARRGELDPVANLVGVRVDDGEARLVLVRREDHAVVV